MIARNSAVLFRSITTVDGDKSFVFALENRGMTISTVTSSGEARTVVSSGDPSDPSNQVPFVRFLSESRVSQSDARASPTVEPTTPWTIALVFVESVVAVFSAQLIGWLLRVGELCTPLSLPQIPSTRENQRVNPNQSDWMQKTILQVDIEPHSLFCPVNPAENTMYFATCVAQHNRAIAESKESSQPRDELPSSLDFDHQGELVIQLPKITCRPSQRVPYFHNTGSLSGALPSTGVNLNLLSASLPWTFRLVGLEVLSTTDARSDHR